jgi:mannose-1-phosphate guanylyltransferase
MNTAVILVGGLGTRLYPVTREIPKPLIPVQGRTLTEHTLDVLKEHGVRKVFFSVCYKADQIQAYFGDGSRFGLEIKYLVEPEQLGTGGWMHLMDEEDIPHEDFMVVNGDNLFDADFHAALALHKRHGALATVALTTVEAVEHYGVVEMNGDAILRFVEKPPREEAPSNKINSGYYIFSPEIFKEIPIERKFMLEKDLFPKLASKGKLFGFASDAQWFDTGTFELWDRVIHEWRKNNVKNPELVKRAKEPVTAKAAQ